MSGGVPFTALRTFRNICRCVLREDGARDDGLFLGRNCLATVEDSSAWDSDQIRAKGDYVLPVSDHYRPYRGPHLQVIRLNQLYQQFSYNERGDSAADRRTNGLAVARLEDGDRLSLLIQRAGQFRRAAMGDPIEGRDCLSVRAALATRRIMKKVESGE